MIKYFLPILLVSCGTDRYSETPVNPPPVATPGPVNPGGGTSKTSFAEIQQLHQQYCISCHANSAFTRNEQSLKNSSAKQRVANGSMPPPNASNKMNDQARELYLNFFTG